MKMWVCFTAVYCTALHSKLYIGMQHTTIQLSRCQSKGSQGGQKYRGTSSVTLIDRKKGTCPAVFCTNCTVMHFILTKCTAVYYTALHPTVLHCTALHCTALHCTAPHCISSYCTALHFSSLHCTATTSAMHHKQLNLAAPQLIDAVYLVHYTILHCT